MKSLAQYIEEQLQAIPDSYKRFGIIVDEDDPYDYDKFLVNNKLIACDESYEKFVELTDLILATLPFDFQHTYEEHQRFIYKLNERLGKSLEYNSLAKKLQNLFGFGEITDVVRSKSKLANSFIIKTDNIDIKDSPRFISLLSYYNYYINTIGSDYMQLSPYKPQEATDTIYNDNSGILYHICTKDQLQKIKKYGLVSRNIKLENIYRPYRRFYISDVSEKNIKTELRLLCNGLIRKINRSNEFKRYSVDKDDAVVLKIDINKSSRKYKFFHDDSASGYHAYFTEETIPPYCVVDAKSFDEI